MAVTDDKPAPYASPSTILGLIERHRDRGLPSPVDADVLTRAGVAESLVARTLLAMEVLDLIDETGKPTDTFEGLRLAPEAEYHLLLQEWVKAAYADIFMYFDPSKDDRTAARDAFRNYQPIGQQPRMITLFLGLCSAAGMPLESTAQSRPQGRVRQSSSLSIRRSQPRRLAKHTNQSRISALGLPPALGGLLESLPSEEKGWTQADRNRFMDTFGTVLDFCFPVIGNGAPQTQQDDHEEVLE